MLRRLFRQPSSMRTGSGMMSKPWGLGSGRDRSTRLLELSSDIIPQGPWAEALRRAAASAAADVAAAAAQELRGGVHRLVQVTPASQQLGMAEPSRPRQAAAVEASSGPSEADKAELERALHLEGQVCIGWALVFAPFYCRRCKWCSLSAWPSSVVSETCVLSDVTRGVGPMCFLLLMSAGLVRTGTRTEDEAHPSLTACSTLRGPPCVPCRCSSASCRWAAWAGPVCTGTRPKK